MIKNSSFSRWLYFLAGTIVGVLIYWIVTKIIEPLVMARQIQKEINQDLTSKKFSDFQKHINNFRKSFPTIGGFSEEKINKIMEELVASKQGKRPTKDKK